MKSGGLRVIRRHILHCQGMVKNYESLIHSMIESIPEKERTLSERLLLADYILKNVTTPNTLPQPYS